MLQILLTHLHGRESNQGQTQLCITSPIHGDGAAKGE